MTTVTVHALSSGSITLPERFFINPSSQTATHKVPSLSFLIQHHSANTNTTTRVLFDLGLRRDLSLYPPSLQAHCATREPLTTKPDVVASLALGGLTVNDIDLIIFSHVHYDHVGLPSDFNNPKTRFLVGPGALDLLSGKTRLDNGSHSVFEPDLLPLDRTTELPPTSQPSTVYPWSSSLPPFNHTIDLFSDQSIYIVDAPGHLPGHINLLCRLSTSSPKSKSNPKYVYLAGDACHDMRLFTGSHEIATWTDDAGKQCCIHADVPQARETLRVLRGVVADGLEVPERDAKAEGEADSDADAEAKAEGEGKKRGEVEVVFAHNWVWEADAHARERIWPGQL